MSENDGNGTGMEGEYRAGRGDRYIPSLQQLSTREGLATTVVRDLTPQQVALFAAMLVNGGNITKSARQVGMNPSYARRLVSKHAVFRQAIRTYGKGMKTCLEDWLDLIPQAKATMVSLLHDEDGKVRYLAAKDILDRAEGKAINRMELNVKDERPVLSEGEIQLAFNLMKSKGISYAEAVVLIRDHPEDAAEWIASHAVAKLESGKPEMSATPGEGPGDVVVEAELLPDDDSAWNDSGQTTEGEEGEDQGAG